MKALAMRLVMACSLLAGCTNGTPASILGLDQIGFDISAARGALIVSLALSREDGTPAPLPSTVSAVRVRLAGNELARPLEAWWRRGDASTQLPELHIEQLNPGPYGLSLVLKDEFGETFASGEAKVQLVAGKTERIRVPLTYQLGTASSTVTVDDATAIGY
jgi:hypothetical protein